MIKRPRWTLYCAALLTVALDQFSKLWALAYLAPIHNIPVLPGFLDLTFVENTGVAFGLFAGRGMLVSALILVLLLTALWLAKDVSWQNLEPNLIGGLVLGGGIGNLLDRARLGYVVDFIDCHFHSLAYWPVFNLADSCICVAVSWIAFRMFFSAKAPVTPPQPQENV